MDQTNRTVLAVGAHPDDVELTCAGTLALLRDKGWDVHIATVSRGDCGTREHSREEISKIRKAEATRAAEMLDAVYHCLGCDDIFIMYDRETIIKSIELVRKVRPSLVFAPSPTDYMVDHETASRLMQTACFSAGIKNVEIAGVEQFESVPHLYYVDAIEGVDILGNEVLPSIVVDIGSTLEIKEQMWCCHESQHHWLVDHHGIDEFMMMIKRITKKRGELIGVDCGEGFRQHLWPAFPQDNLLEAELVGLVHLL